jgi:KaiC/GvpD/RAD55 family RecA-like ATPase
MSKIVSLLLLAVLIVGVAPSNFSVAEPATRATRNIVLYAHTDEKAASVGGRILSAAPVSGFRSTADATKIVIFTLVPPLVAPLHILGTVAANVWLQAGQTVSGTLYVGISAVLVDGTVVPIKSANVSASVRQTRPVGIIFSFGGTNRTLSSGSTIRLEVQFMPTVQTSVLLIWDDYSAATSLTIEVEHTILLGIRTVGTNGQPSNVFPSNNTGDATVIAQANIVDAFGIHDIRNVTLSVRNDTDSLVISNAPLLYVEGDLSSGTYIFELRITLSLGRYRLFATAIDISNSSYTAASDAEVTEFHPVTIVVADQNGRPVQDAIIAILLNSTVVSSNRTDSEGVVHLSAPSSSQVGPFSIVMRREGAEILLADSINILGHDMIRLEAPLSDWTILVRYQTLGFPIIGATVRVEVENSTVAWGATGSNGSVTFKQMAAGNNTIAIENAWLKYQVTLDHSLERATSTVDVPLAFVIQMLLAFVIRTWFGIFLLVLISAFGIYAIRRSRKRRPVSFAHFKAILGGALPSASITMISGNPGSGKTQMIYSIMLERLAQNGPAIFVTNVEFPAKVREALKRLGTDAAALEKRETVRFVDCYAGLAGVQSGEAHHVSSPTDFTTLGVQISSCLEETGGRGDVYVDSITPTIVNGAFERALSFVRYYGARVKAEDASLFYTISSSIEPKTLTKFEDEADCVIQLDLYESAGVTKRRMRVKKARGLSHAQDWIEFTINQRGAIEFLPD